MKKLALYICLLVNSIVVFGQQQVDNQRSKLVVGIVVDQMRWDYLYRFADRYGDGGFKRMMNEGFNCQNTMINYLPTFTGPGHAAVYTGSVPAIHGIAANDWVERSTGKSVYCVDDMNVKSVGGSTKAGKMSPANMLTTTITDELQIATKKRSKIFGIGIKDRGSILPAGHSADGAFWFDDSTGNFITSSYYMNELPSWLRKFNSRRWADTIMSEEWNLLYPLNTYTGSTNDDTPYEGKFPGEKAPVFPHPTSNVKGRGYYGVRYVPGGNSITLAAAKACIQGESMGKDAITDFLCITLSTTDYAGHNYGPDAVEIEDMYLRLDMELERLYEYLDKAVGVGAYTVFLTADHGAANNALYMRDMKIPAGSQTQASATSELNKHLLNSFNIESLVLSLSNYSVYLNEKLLKDNKEIDREKLKAVIKDWLYEQEGVANVIDLEDFDDELVPQPIRDMVVNGYYRERSGCIQIIMKPGWYSGYAETGTTHGSWNAYDTHIPLLWYGWGIKKGESFRTINMTDIAPTLAALLHIQMPNGCIGNVITEIIE